MNDEELMRSIARAAKRDANGDTLDPRWDDVSRGELDAKALASITDEKDADVAAAFAPFDKDFRAQLATSAAAALGADKSRDTDTNVVTLPARSRRAWAFSLAASAVLGIGLATTLLDQDSSDGVVLPHYTHTFRGTADMRSSSDTDVASRVRADQNFALDLAPQTAYSGGPRVRLYAQTATGERAISPETTAVMPSGVVRLSADAGQLGVGNVTLIVVISGGSWPDADQRRRPAASDAWQVLHIPLEVVAGK